MSKVYLVGPAGAGKTSRLIERLVELLSNNVRPDRILVLVPQQVQARAFRVAQAKGARNAVRAHGEPDITTIYGLAQQHVSLFFPVIAGRAGFSQPQREPVMINVEAAQYLLDQIVEPRTADFDDLKLFRPRLLGQILDSMNKAAECGFGLDEIAERLSSAWTGDAQRLQSYRRVQDVAQYFRQYCFDHSLLDFSLQMETFSRHLLNAPSYRDYIAARYRHVLIDNIEENPPVMHDFLKEVLRTCDSALLAEDEPGGYRIYLGADVDSARTLRPLCDEVMALEHSHTASPEAIAFGKALAVQFVPASGASSLPGPQEGEESQTPGGGGPRAALGDVPGSTKYWTGMVNWVVSHVTRLVSDGVRPREIAVLAPYVEDVLRFELQERLRPFEIRVRAVRPSRPLHDHPVVRMLVAFARLANPQWAQFVPASDLSRALAVGIANLDVSRAQLIADAALKASTRLLAPLDDPALWQRVGMRFYQPYSILQKWVAEGGDSRREEDPRKPNIPLDLFWQQLFTDVLSQAGFGLSEDREGALVADKLIRSARSFRETFERGQLAPEDLPARQYVKAPLAGEAEAPPAPAFDIGLEYVNTLGEDIIAAQYAPEREPDIADDDAVLVTPAYTYLINNFRSRYQFWLDINSLGWYERVYQPLTHPYVLSRRWERGRKWTEEDEHRTRQLMLSKVLLGLTYRCADRIFLASSQLSISGQEEAGPLARAVQRVIGRNTVEPPIS